MTAYSAEQLPDLLPLYYKKLFPFGPYYRWLSYGNIDPQCFPCREFSFTLEDDIYIRYQSFSNQDEMEKAIQQKCPFKIDIGAVFNANPKYYRRPSVLPIQKELVFDIDMTDYDDVRTCCSGADICNKCWKFMVLAAKILDSALREDFGFEHLLWVFSGRRGVHCWVCDEAARLLDQSARSAVAEYLQLVSGGINQAKKVNIPADIHPSIKRAINIISKEFEEMIVLDQDFLGSKEQVAKVLSLISDFKLREEVEKEMNNHSSSKDRWSSLVKAVDHYYQSKATSKWKVKHVVEEIMIQYAYPRLDINVSKGLNHLLKSPFCIHPKTGKVCCPFKPRSASKFDPTTVPTISELVEEIRVYDEKQSEIKTEDDVSRRVKGYKKTSLNSSVHIFEEFLRKLEASWKGKKIEISDQKMEF